MTNLGRMLEQEHSVLRTDSNTPSYFIYMAANVIVNLFFFNLLFSCCNVSLSPLPTYKHTYTLTQAQVLTQTHKADIAQDPKSLLWAIPNEFMTEKLLMKKGSIFEKALRQKWSMNSKYLCITDQ